MQSSYIFHMFYVIEMDFYTTTNTKIYFFQLYEITDISRHLIFLIILLKFFFFFSATKKNIIFPAKYQ